VPRASITVLACAMLALAGGEALAQAQVPTQALAPTVAPKTCVQQYTEAQGTTPAGLINGGFEIKAGLPGGLWLQKGKETYFCNTGRPPDNEPLCWTLREPVRGSPCP
jgi:hypothetical protein